MFFTIKLTIIYGIYRRPITVFSLYIIFYSNRFRDVRYNNNIISSFPSIRVNKTGNGLSINYYHYYHYNYTA